MELLDIAVMKCEVIYERALSQISFFLTVAGLVFGVLSAWQIIVRVMSLYWPFLIVACAVPGIAIGVAQHCSRRQVKRQQDTRSVEALTAVSELIAAHETVSYADAVNYLSHRFGDEAKSLIDSFLTKRILRIDSNERLERRISDE